MISKAKYALQKSFALQFFIGGQVVMQGTKIYLKLETIMPDPAYLISIMVH